MNFFICVVLLACVICVYSVEPTIKGPQDRQINHLIAAYTFAPNDNAESSAQSVPRRPVPRRPVPRPSDGPLDFEYIKDNDRVHDLWKREIGYVLGGQLYKTGLFGPLAIIQPLPGYTIVRNKRMIVATYDQHKFWIIHRAAYAHELHKILGPNHPEILKARAAIKEEPNQGNGA